MTTKRVNRPKTVKVKNNEYKIVSKTREWKEENGAYGMIHFDKNLIEIANSQSKQNLVDTVLHEILHAIVEEYKIKFTHHKVEERIVTHISQGLTAVFKDNPNLIEWIKEKSK